MLAEQVVYSSYVARDQGRVKKKIKQDTVLTLSPPYTWNGYSRDILAKLTFLGRSSVFKRLISEHEFPPDFCARSEFGAFL